MNKKIIFSFKIFLIIFIFNNFGFSKQIGNIKIEFNEKDIYDLLQESAPISFNKMKNLRGGLYIKKFDRVKILNKGKYLVDVALEGRELVYYTSILGQDINIDIGNLIFFLTFKVDTFFENNKIFYEISVSEQRRKNPMYVGKFILPLLNVYFQSKKSSIGGEDILKPFKYKQYSNDMEATFLIRSYKVENKIVKIQVGMNFIKH